jgi:hypothetical protein
MLDGYVQHTRAKTTIFPAVLLRQIKIKLPRFSKTLAVGDAVYAYIAGNDKMQSSRLTLIALCGPVIFPLTIKRWVKTRHIEVQGEDGMGCAVMPAHLLHRISDAPAAFADIYLHHRASRPSPGYSPTRLLSCWYLTPDEQRSYDDDSFIPLEHAVANMEITDEL